MRTQSILTLLACFVLSGLTMPAVACPPGDCDDCETWNPETETCDWDCTADQCCDGGSCVDDCPTGECCDEGNCEPMEMDSLTSNKASACIGCDITFTATTDPTGYEDDVEWSGGGEPETGSGATFTTHWDTSGTKTVTAVLCDSSESKQVTIVKVDKVVESGTTDEGPIYVCPDDTVSLEAKSNPSDTSFPSGEPHWSIESQPEGASASLSPSSGSTTTTLSGITKYGEYVIKAKCGDSDSGDSITVSTPSTSGPWEDWIPFSDCPPENWSFLEDDCDNWLSVYCDSTNHLSAQAFSWWYTNGQPPWVNRGTEVGCCVWNGGSNLAQYKYSFPGKKLYLKTEQVSCNNHKGFWDPHGEGCTWYYCFRFVTFDCVTSGANPNVNWYRDSDICYCEMGTWPNPSSSDNCPGSPGIHPGYPD
jgi:hypothetical protein